MIDLTERETKIVAAATMYAELFSDTGLPGHNLLMLIDKLNKNSRELFVMLFPVELQPSNDDDAPKTLR